MSPSAAPAVGLLDEELVLDVALSVVVGDLVLDEALRAHRVVRTVLFPGQLRLVGGDGWVETVATDQVVARLVRRRPGGARA